MNLKENAIIFIVDDDPFWSSLLEQLLVELGYHNIVKYKNGRDCLNNIHFRPSLVFLDYEMSDMNGLEVISETGKGSQFYFSVEFPMVSQAGESTEQITDQEPDLKNKKILLVEDTAFNVLFATQLLEGWNALVDVAENGAIAVDMVKQNQYDLILMDLQMPVMDGYTASRKIREYNQALPIIALTASATSNVKSKVLEAGMQDYVTKPFNPNDFFLRLKKYL